MSWTSPKIWSFVYCQNNNPTAYIDTLITNAKEQISTSISYRAFSLTWPASMQIYWNKKSVCIRKKFNSHRICLGHQHGRRFIVLGHQYGRRDVMWKHSICHTSCILSGALVLNTLCLLKNYEEWQMLSSANKGEKCCYLLYCRVVNARNFYPFFNNTRYRVF